MTIRKGEPGYGEGRGRAHGARTYDHDVTFAHKSAGAFANGIGQPAVFGEILVGLLLGPTLFDVLAWPLFAAPKGEISSLPARIRDFGETAIFFLTAGNQEASIASIADENGN